MAKRPVFIVDYSDNNHVIEEFVDFEWFAGFSESQKQKSIESLHNEFLKMHSKSNILEISSKSKEILGVNLSAFNLKLFNKYSKNRIPVECVFQSSKVFQYGGPFTDLLEKTPIEAKRDDRLKSSGELVNFLLDNEKWGLNPKTLFYDWVYLNAVSQNKELAQEIVNYDAFTDIEFNPKKSFNCQARSAAFYVSLYKKGVLKDLLSDVRKYKDFFKEKDNLFKEKEFKQTSFL